MKISSDFSCDQRSTDSYSKNSVVFNSSGIDSDTSSDDSSSIYDEDEKIIELKQSPTKESRQNNYNRRLSKAKILFLICEDSEIQDIEQRINTWLDLQNVHMVVPDPEYDHFAEIKRNLLYKKFQSMHDIGYLDDSGRESDEEYSPNDRDEIEEEDYEGVYSHDDLNMENIRKKQNSIKIKCLDQISQKNKPPITLSKIKPIASNQNNQNQIQINNNTKEKNSGNQNNKVSQSIQQQDCYKDDCLVSSPHAFHQSSLLLRRKKIKLQIKM